MKEQTQHQSKKEIKWPQLGKVEVDSSVDFIYIMRKDRNFAMLPIADRMASKYDIDEEPIKQILLEEYDTYFSKLAAILQWGFAFKGNFELHVYDSDKLEQGVREKA